MEDVVNACQLEYREELIGGKEVPERKRYCRDGWLLKEYVSCIPFVVD